MPEVAEVVDGVNDAPGAGIFDSIAIKEPVRSEPKLETGDQVEPEVEEAVEPEPEVKVEAKVEPEVKETPEPKTEEAKTYAGRFKKVEDLEVAYEQSSKEGKRLYDTVKEKESALEAKEAEIAELKAKLEEGPAPKELTEDELSQMSPHQVAQYFAEKTKREILGQQKKEKTEAQTKRQKQESEDTRRAILSDVEVMRKDKEKYPDFEDLQPVMKDIMDRFPAVTGYRETPMFLYWAAKGREHLKSNSKGKEATSEARKAAEDKAKADAARTGKTGPGATGRPGGEGTKSPDQDWHDKILRAGSNKPLFPGV